MSDNPFNAIGNALQQLDDLRSNIANVGSTMLEIANEGVGIVKEQMSKYGIPTNGDLGDSVTATQVDNLSARLEADGGHATFVEFGTGIVGKNSPHSEADERGVTYDRNAHGEQGWVYYKNGRFYRTKGQPSRPFMYSAGKIIVKRGTKLVLSKLKAKGASK